MGTTSNYVFVEGNISDDTEWWNDAFINRRTVTYVTKDNLFAGDKVFVDEVIRRLNETDKLPTPPASYPIFPCDTTTTTSSSSTTQPSTNDQVNWLSILMILPLIVVARKRRRSK